MASTIPSVLINAKLYGEDGNEMLGIANAELPDFEYMTESMAGFGIAGEIDVPVLGHFASMTMTVSWNTVCDGAVNLLAPKTHSFVMYASVQGWDTEKGTHEPTPVKVQVRAMPKKSGIGKFEPGSKMEPESEFEISYIKMSMNGTTALEIDKLNSICVINGVDYLEKVRGHLGM